MNWQLGFIVGMLVGILISALGILIYIVESVKKYEKDEENLREIS